MPRRPAGEKEDGGLRFPNPPYGLIEVGVDLDHLEEQGMTKGLLGLPKLVIMLPRRSAHIWMPNAISPPITAPAIGCPELTAEGRGC